MKILITGTAGFIGSYLARRLASRGDNVIGIDCINDYYDVNLKYARLEWGGISREHIKYGEEVSSSEFPSYTFIQLKLEDEESMKALFDKYAFDVVVNLAAQAGVRYSIKNPQAYITSNMRGFTNVLECCRASESVRHLVYASSSSVYGGNKKVPFAEDDRVDDPASVYAATKRSNELLAHVYADLYGLNSTALRFFTVYGPWGRPDMAPWLFADAILHDKPIRVFNNGNLSRDFTYIDDIIEGVVRTVDAEVTSTRSEIYNIGCGHPVQLMDFIHTIEEKLGKEAIKEFVPMQKGDVYQTYADITKFERDFGYVAQTSLKEGISQQMDWFTMFLKK